MVIIIYYAILLLQLKTKTTATHILIMIGFLMIIGGDAVYYWPFLISV
jgi:hypothetical protein